MFSPTLTIFLNLCLAALTFAAPLSNEKLTTMGNAQQMGAGGGVLCFAVLILDILVWVEVIKSTRPPSHKLLWCVLVFLLPVVGPILYYVFSDRAKHNPEAGGYEQIAWESGRLSGRIVLWEERTAGVADDLDGTIATPSEDSSVRLRRATIAGSPRTSCKASLVVERSL
ncbi:hypothetical protein LTR91_024353 [Friedmanniomyces endolithicus]|uniref:Cardiolipin synthase N-terminal domain-containing protein n=1 Tax=Friedmanniomyces endolithicus TaxID=329885 RepID=A0AAN6H2U7_9PEZI|nr:hypothetical protein LTR91_024353 [Friedmanniomyces endolithicus]